MEYVVLSPYPPYSSGNVGDRLLLESTLDLVEEICGPTELNVHFRTEDFTSRQDYLNRMDGVILCGFEYPKIANGPDFRIAENLDMVEPPLIPIGSIHRFFPGDALALAQQHLETPVRSFLDRVVPSCPDGNLPVRTAWVGHVLQQNGYDITLTGDPGLFDTSFIGEEFHRPDEIEQLVFTTPHWAMYVDQAKELLRRLSRRFPDATRIVSLHSVPDEVDRELMDFARDFGWEIRYASHDLENIELYRDSDLHVGYRFHGHLAHLRWRRPSVILAEDSRAQGFNETLGTAGVRAFEPREGIARKFGEIYDWFPVIGLYFLLENYGYEKKLPPRRTLVARLNPTAVDDVLEFVTRQQENDWQAYGHARSRIDDIYEEGMKPFLEDALHS